MKSLVIVCFCMSSLVLAMDPQKLSSSWPIDNNSRQEKLQKELEKCDQQVDHFSDLLKKNLLVTEKLFEENQKQIEHNAHLITRVYALKEQTEALEKRMSALEEKDPPSE